MTKKIPDDLALTYEQVREVVERAARHAPLSERVSLQELRQIASELDIAPEALDEALQAVLYPPTLVRFRSWFGRQVTRLGTLVERVLPPRARFASAAALGGFLGWASAFVMSLAPFTIGSIAVRSGAGAIVDVPVAVALILLTVANSLGRRVHGGLLRYLLESYSLWVGYGVGWVLTHGAMTNDIATWLAICLSGVTVWGWIAVTGGNHSAPGGLLIEPQRIRSTRSDRTPDEHEESGFMRVMRSSSESPILLRLAPGRDLPSGGTA